MLAFGAVWGPFVLLGVMSLWSEDNGAISALWIEHGISNLMIPAYLYAGYELYTNFEQATVAGYAAASLVTFSL